MEDTNIHKADSDRSIMPRLNWGHLIVMTAFLIPNLIGAAISGGPVWAISSCFWLFYPCKDPQFGNGKKYFWIRQTALLIGIAATWLIG